MFRAWRLYRHNIVTDGDPYMTRWVFRHPWGTVRLHRIYREDRDPHPHDHPWAFISLILWGGYREERYHRIQAVGKPATFESRWIRRGSINRVHATSVHRIAEVLPNTWTLCLSGPKVRSWCFHTPEGPVPWRTYLGLA